MGFTVHDGCFRVEDSGFKVRGAGLGDRGSGFRVQGSGFRVQGSGFRVQGSGFRVQGSGFRVQGPGIRVYTFQQAETQRKFRVCLPLPLRSPHPISPFLLSQQVLIKSFCKSRFPNKSVSLFFILVIVKDKLTHQIFG